MSRTSKGIRAGLLFAALVGAALVGSLRPPLPGFVAAAAAGPAAAWTQVSPSASPPAMAGALMAYSPRADRFVLFGGWNGTTGLNGTWVYDPGNRTWEETHPRSSPPSRGDGMFVYDSSADVFLLFGGWHENADGSYVRLGDTWRYSLSVDTWERLDPAVSPSPRSDAEVAYDPAAGALLLVGGFNGTAYLGDVWSFFPANDTWVPRPSGVQPSPRSDGRMVYVAAQDRFILFGGNDYSGPNFSFHHLNDTWTYGWSTHTWTRFDTLVAPSARDYPVLAYDSAAGQVLLTGGFGNNTVLSDLWTLNATTRSWTDITPAASPPPRFAAAGGFDSADGALVVFGGASDTGLLADTWLYSTVPASAPPGPSPALVALGSGLFITFAVAVVLVVLRPWARRSRRAPGRPPENP